MSIKTVKEIASRLDVKVDNATAYNIGSYSGYGLKSVLDRLINLKLIESEDPLYTAVDTKHVRTLAKAITHIYLETALLPLGTDMDTIIVTGAKNTEHATFEMAYRYHAQIKAIMTSLLTKGRLIEAMKRVNFER